MNKLSRKFKYISRDEKLTSLNLSIIDYLLIAFKINDKNSTRDDEYCKTQFAIMIDGSLVEVVEQKRFISKSTTVDIDQAVFTAKLGSLCDSPERELSDEELKEVIVDLEEYEEDEFFIHEIEFEVRILLEQDND